MLSYDTTVDEADSQTEKSASRKTEVLEQEEREVDPSWTSNFAASYALTVGA